jgi:metallo-beta-lactamase family protein
MAKLTPYGGAGSTTGANFLLELSDKKLLIDCGMEQGSKEAYKRNHEKFFYDPASIDTLFITHAHIDHIGLIPKLYREGFRGEIYSTQETKSIAELLLLDAAKIGRDEGTALYTPEDISSSMLLWKTLRYHESKDFGSFSLELFNAGHILGSAMLKFTFKNGKSMLFSGDIGNSPSPILPDREKVEGLDYLLMESVYGDRNHEGRELRDTKFTQVVKDAMKRGGTLLIPAFSLERTQMLLAKLDNLFESGELPSVPVYLDSPLAQKITLIYERVKSLYNEETTKEIKRGDDIFKFKELHEIANVRESHAIHLAPGAKIIIAGSGMSTAGRILSHEEKYLPDPNSTILLAGYQALGTLGRQIEEGMKTVIIDEHKVSVRARVEKIDGFSGHADSNALVEFVNESASTLKKVFVAMGEPRSQIFLSQRLRDELGVDAVVAEKGKTYELDF